MIPEQSYYLCIKKENSVAVLALFMTSNTSNFNLQKAFNLKMNSAYEKDSAHEMHSKINLQKTLNTLRYSTYKNTINT